MSRRPPRLQIVAAVVLSCSGCVDKAPPPLWPAPPPPSVAEVLGDPTQSKPVAPPPVAVGASALTGPPSALDAVKVDKASILDPEGPAATGAAQAHPPTSPRPVPTHR